MPDIAVKDLMVPKDAYATVSVDGTLQDVALALRDARAHENPEHRARDRAVLVIWQAHVIGKLTMLDLIRSLGPHREHRKTGASSLGPLIESMTKEFTLRQTPLPRLVEKAYNLSIRDMLRPCGKDETIAIDAPLDKALHQFISGEYRSLLVTDDDEIVGILRLVDVYEHISEMIIACEPKV